jgi:gamma-glutamyltranspeptidase / glutathione hydrolase
MVAAANPLATDAGYEILMAGGSAVDAAIAVQMVLALVEPQSSGIGGGAFLLHWDGSQVQALDGRETAPAAATPDLFVRENGEPMPTSEAIVGGRSVGAPGLLRMLAAAHREHGRLPWARLFEPAIDLCERGFSISPRLARLLAGDQALLRDPDARAYFYEADGSARGEGDTLVNQPLADVLRAVAEGGAEVFYSGDIARDIVARVREHPTNPGLLTLEDVARYEPRAREPLCFDYRRWRLCGMPPPGTGTVALAQIFGILEEHDLASLPPTRAADGRWHLAPAAVHLYAEAARLAYADRDAYIADPDVVPVPLRGLVDRTYIRSRSLRIGERSMGRAEPGMPPGASVAAGLDASPELPSTSHISVVDAEGRAVAMTTTIEDGFGSRVFVRGFLLNNQLTDFSLRPADAGGRPVANRVQGGKRPRSTMTPLLVFDRASGALEMTLGSPGGSAIINYVGKVLVGTLDWGLDPQQATSLPNTGSRNGPTELERGRVHDDLVAALEARGHDVQLIAQTSGVQVIRRTATGWFGGADPRREGTARGE